MCILINHYYYYYYYYYPSTADMTGDRHIEFWTQHRLHMGAPQVSQVVKAC